MEINRSLVIHFARDQNLTTITNTTSLNLLNTLLYLHLFSQSSFHIRPVILNFNSCLSPPEK